MLICTSKITTQGVLEAILVVTDPLDIEAIESWLARMVGRQDQRRDKLDTLLDKLDLRDGR